jgi:hypothetical protein
VSLRSGARTIQVSVRESRLCVDRILLVAGIPSGYVAAVRECVLLSQALRLGGFAYLLAHHGELQMASLEDIRIVDQPDGSLEVDAAGTHAWLLAPAVTDLAVDIARKAGRAELRLRRVRQAIELNTVAALATRHGASAELRVHQHRDAGHAHVEDLDMGHRDQGTDRDAHGATLAMINAPRPRTAEQWDPLLFAALRDGFAVAEPLWCAVHALSNAALAPDSVVSRRHAGPVILQDDGSIFGRRPADDDFDFNMLRNVAPTPAESPR